MLFATVVLACVLGTQSGPSVGEQSADFATDLFLQTWSLANEYELPEGIELRYRVIKYPLGLTVREIGQLRDRVRGRPDHPDRAILETELRRAREPDVTTVTVWFDGSGSWRINRNEPWQNMYVDAAFTNTSVWALTPSSLSLYQTGKAQSPNSIIVLEGDLLAEVRKLLWNGWGAYEASAIVVHSASLSDNTLTVEVSLPNETVWRHVASLSDDQTRLIVTNSTILDAPRFPGLVGSSRVRTGWAFEPLLETW